MLRSDVAVTRRTEGTTLNLGGCKGLTSLSLEGLAALQELWLRLLGPDIAAVAQSDDGAAHPRPERLGPDVVAVALGLELMISPERLLGLTSLSLNELPALKMLDLRKCSGLTSLPPFERLPSPQVTWRLPLGPEVQVRRLV